MGLPLITNAQRSSLIDYWWGQWQLSLPPGQYVPDIIPNATYTLGCALQRDHPPPKFCSHTLPSTAPSLSSPRDGLKVQDEDSARNLGTLPAQP